MRALQLLFFASLWLVCMVVDVTLFFLVVRISVRRSRTWWLVGLDAAGGRLIDSLLPRVASLWHKVFHTTLSDRDRLITALVVFCLAWLVVHSAVSALW